MNDLRLAYHCVIISAVTGQVFSYARSQSPNNSNVYWRDYDVGAFADVRVSRIETPPLSSFARISPVSRITDDRRRRIITHLRPFLSHGRSTKMAKFFFFFLKIVRRFRHVRDNTRNERNAYFNPKELIRMIGSSGGCGPRQPTPNSWEKGEDEDPKELPFYVRTRNVCTNVVFTPALHTIDRKRSANK